MPETNKNIFSLKRETENILAEVAGAPYTYDSVEQGASKLIGLGEDALPFVARYLEKTRDISATEKLLHIIELMNDHSCTDVLRSFLYRRPVSQDIKVECLATLKSYENLNDSDLQHFFENTEATFFAWVEKVLENYHDREFRAISLLEEFLTGGLEKAGQLKNVAAKLGVKALPLLSDLAYSDNKEIAGLAIMELGRMEDPQAARELKEICEYSWHSVSADMARKALRRRSFAGIDDSSVAVGPLYEFSKEKCTAFISPVDSQGDATLCLVAEGKDERSEALCVVCNDEAGIIDVYGSRRIKKNEISQMIDDIQAEEAIFVEVELEHFIKFLNNALYLNESYSFPLPIEFVYRKDMLKGHLTPRPLIHEFSLSELRRIRKDTSLSLRGAELLEKDAFIQWPLSSTSSFDYAEQWLYTKKDRPASIRDRAFVDQFSFEVLLHNKKLTSKRLIWMAQFLKNAGDTDGAELCLASALELSSRSGRQFVEIPFIKALAKKSIEYCATQISEGMDPREYYEDID